MHILKKNLGGRGGVECLNPLNPSYLLSFPTSLNKYDLMFASTPNSYLFWNHYDLAHNIPNYIGIIFCPSYIK